MILVHPKSVKLTTIALKREKATAIERAIKKHRPYTKNEAKKIRTGYFTGEIEKRSEEE